MTAAAARRLESKFTAKLVGWTRSYLGLTYRELGTLAGAATRTAQRWGDPKGVAVPSGDHRVKIEQLHEVKRLLASTFSNEEVALEWLYRDVPMLKGRRPIDLIRRGDLQPVVDVLAGAHSGAFA